MTPVHAAVVRTPIDAAAVMRRVGDPAHGATLMFVGVVRDHAEGRSVSGMRYDAYEPMALDVLRTIAAEAAERLGTESIAVVHRVGELAVGEASVAVAVSSPHRAESYDASRYVIEQIKTRLPVWKKERYSDGDASWVGGAVPPVGDRA